MFDKTTQLFTEYQYEMGLRKKAERFAKYSIECPSCGKRAILPATDYLCRACRESASPTLGSALSNL